MKIFLINVFLLVYSIKSEFSAKTQCAMFFFTDGKNIGQFRDQLFNKCQEIIKKQQFTEENGCIQCYSRHSNQLFELNFTEAAKGICMGSKSSCKTKTDKDIKNIFQNFIKSIDTTEKIKSVLGVSDINLTREIFYEEDANPSSDSITAEIVKHTKDALTFKLISSSISPLKCICAIEANEPEFSSKDNFYIIKPGTEVVKSEYFPSYNYDCKKYQLYLQCSPLYPLGDVQSFTKYHFFEINHQDDNTRCKYKFASSSLSALTITLIVIGSVIGIGVIVALVLTFCRKDNNLMTKLLSSSD